MSRPSFFRSVALALTLLTALSFGSRLSVRKPDHIPERSARPCDLGLFRCTELKDDQVEEQIAPSGGWYINRAYTNGKDNIDFFAVSAPGLSAKDPSLCPRMQGWKVLWNEKSKVLTATGFVPARQYTLELSEAGSQQTECAIGLWQRESTFLDNPLQVRLYALMDSLFYSRPNLISIWFVTTIQGASAATANPGCFTPLKRLLANWSSESAY